MTMRFNQIVTHFQPEEALTIIEFLDQLRAVLMETYGDQIAQRLNEASDPDAIGTPPDDEDPF